MKYILKYLKKYKIRAILAPLFKMLEASFELLVPLVMLRLIDIGIANNDKDYVIRMGMVLILLTVVGYLASITAQYFSARAAMGVGKQLRSELFRHISSFSFNEIDTYGSATLITRMTSDVNQVISGVNMFLRLFLRSPFIVIGAVVMAFTVDVHTSIVFAVVLPFLVAVVFFITFSSIPKYKKVQKALDRVTLLTRESLIGVRVIRAFNRQELEEKEFFEAADNLKVAQIRVGRLSSFMNPVTYGIVNLGIAGLIYVGAVRVDAGLLTRGQVVALVNYMSQILVELVKLANLVIILTKALASINRISDIMDTQSSIKYKDAVETADYTDKHTLCFDHVSMSYAGSKENSIEDISFEVSSGQTIGIIGGTGSGKSTLVNLIPRFYDVSSGCIKLDGTDIKDISKDSLRGRVSIVPQKNVLFRGTISENLKVANPNASDDDITKAIRDSQSEEFVSKKEGGLGFEIDQGGKNLSGGQRQRLCIARALVKKAQILILDDSSSALDYITEAKLHRALREGSESRITIIVSQRASSIMHADKIVVMDDGKAVAIGTHDELYKTNEIYREICLTQFKEKEGVA
ncbi:MAG: ABC transporter ATP-binding protein/permease [Eubacterium sp.]|nr:ABC transporter ATP-binding protein/permease [Eubacterium sp.]